MFTTLLMAMLLANLNPTAPAVMAPPAKPAAQAQEPADDDGGIVVATDGAHRLVFRPADGQAQGQGDSATGSGVAPRVIKLHKTMSDLPAGGPWIGIQFGPLPKPLATHLALDAGQGQMVLNVAEQSPADFSGFQQFDVITAIDSQSVPADMGEFLTRVRGFAANETHAFTLRRAGQQLTVNITVGARPEDLDTVKYKYEQPMEDVSFGRVFGRGGMLGKDHSGKWVFKGLDMKDMPDFFKALPDASTFDFHFQPDGGGHRFFLSTTEGDEVRIAREDDGKVTVVRTKKEGDHSTTTTATYNNYDEFKAQEPELSKKFHFLKDGENTFEFCFPESMNKLGPEWTEKLHNHLMKLAHGGGFAGEPTTRFDVQTDGQIKVTSRSGETEVVESFRNADELKSMRPDLYKKYEKFQARRSPGQ